MLRDVSDHRLNALLSLVRSNSARYFAFPKILRRRPFYFLPTTLSEIASLDVGQLIIPRINSKTINNETFVHICLIS